MSAPSFPAWDWTREPETIERVRRLARDAHIEGVAMVAVLREFALYADGVTGGNAFPSERTITEAIGAGQNRRRIRRCIELLEGAGLLIDTGVKRGKGGTIVYRLPIGTGDALDVSSSTADGTGDAQGVTSSAETGDKLETTGVPYQGPSSPIGEEREPAVVGRARASEQQALSTTSPGEDNDNGVVVTLPPLNGVAPRRQLPTKETVEVTSAATYISGVLERGIDSIPDDAQGRPPTPERVQRAINGVPTATHDDISNAAQEARAIVQAQGRAGDITALFASKLEQWARVTA